MQQQRFMLHWWRNHNTTKTERIVAAHFSLSPLPFPPSCPNSARVEHGFKAENDEELTVRVGEMVELLQWFGDDWVMARKANGAEGAYTVFADIFVAKPFFFQFLALGFFRCLYLPIYLRLFAPITNVRYQ